VQRVATLISAALAFAIGGAAVAEPPIPVELVDTEPILLRYRFVSGDVDAYRIEIDHELIVSGPALEQPAATAARMVIDTDQTVVSTAEDGSARLRQRITASTVNMSVNDVSLSTDDIAMMLNGLTLSFDMTGTGDVSDTTVEDVPDPQMAQMVSLVQDSIRHTTIAFPEEPVAVGGQWTQEIPVDLEQPEMQFDTRIAATYTFLGYATIDEVQVAVLQSDLDVSLSGSFTDAGLRTTAEGSGTGIGYTYFDDASGKLVRGSMEIELQTDISAEGMEFVQALTMAMRVMRL